MKAIVFGATGMIGQGVVRECLLDADVKRVLTVGRSVTGQTHDKLREIAHADLRDLSSIERDLTGYDAGFFCLGVSSAGMSEADYRRVTVDITVAAATTLARLNPSMTFVFVSGAGTDAHGRSMWARVKGEAENAVLALPFKGAYVFRPAFIRPMHGIRSRTSAYRYVYLVAAPIAPVLKALFPRQVTSTEELGRAMISVARRGYSKRVIENGDVNDIARSAAQIAADP